MKMISGFILAALVISGSFMAALHIGDAARTTLAIFPAAIGSALVMIFAPQRWLAAAFFAMLLGIPIAARVLAGPEWVGVVGFAILGGDCLGGALRDILKRPG